MERRKIAGLVVVAALGAAVVIDRASGGEGEGTGADAATSARAEYLRRAETLAQAESLVATEAAWREAARAAREEWEAARTGLIVAPSANVAQTRLSEVVGRELEFAGARLRVSDVLPERAPLDGEALRVVGMRLDFETQTPEALYALLDRLENMSDVRTNIERLVIAGPGRTGATGLTVKMDLVALAWIES